MVLEGPNGVLVDQKLWFSFKASNNQIEYETLIAEMIQEKEMGVTDLTAKSDSLIILGQVSSEFKAKYP